MKVYRQHRCRGYHARGFDFVLCAIPRLEGVYGRGEYAVIAWCGRTVWLFTDEEEAHGLMDKYEFDGCGPGCKEKHDIVRIDPGPAAVPTPTSDPYLDYLEEVTQ